MKIYKKILLLNSANMFNDGLYNKRTISKNQFIKLIKNAEHIKSSIGYKSVVKLIEELTGIKVEVNREMTNIDSSFLIVGLTIPIRLSEQSKGRRDPGEGDYVYFMAVYKDKN